MCGGTKRGGRMIEKRIAYFVSKWLLHQQVVDGAWMLAEKGYVVDLFLYQTSSDFHKMKNHPNIHIHDFTLDKKENKIFSWDNVKLFSKDYLDILNENKKIVVFGTGQRAQELIGVFPINIAYYVDNDSGKWGTSFLGKKVYAPDELIKEESSNLYILIASMYHMEIEKQLNDTGFEKDLNVVYNATEIVEQFIFFEHVIKKSKEIIEKYRYSTFIGVEKFGLIWAGMLAEEFNIPYIYHSLELYTSDHPRWSHSKFQFLLQLEAIYHQKAIATIIQDESRKNVLFSEHRIENGQPLYVTISILDEKLPINKKQFWHEKFNIPIHKKIILLLSIIAPTRYCKELVQASQHLSDEFQIIIQGPIFDEKYYNELKASDRNKKVILSTEIYSEEHLQAMILSADIGLAFYHSNPINDRLTPYSSEKIARYLQAGLPIITFDYDEYKKMFEDLNCGRYIDREFDNFPIALGDICDNYENYSKSAKEAFVKSYDYQKQFKKVIDFIEELTYM